MDGLEKIQLLVIDDDRYFGMAVRDMLAGEEMEIHLAASCSDGLAMCARKAMDIVLLDQNLPDGQGHGLCRELLCRNNRAKIILITAYPSFPKAVEAVKGGAYDYLSKPVDPERLKLLLRRAWETICLERKERILGYQRSQRFQKAFSVGVTASWREIENQVDVARKASASVLITGETGTGKSMVARRIAAGTGNGANPFIEVNCAAIPESLMEAEFFGHERGAFTGALSARPGLFELADGGTLFLDEIGELPNPMQAKLLGVLDSGIIRRIGAQATRETRVRILAASNLDLEKAISQGRFRCDLFFRLSVMRIHLPPLRERRDDIPVLCRHFLMQLLKERDAQQCRLEEEEMERLKEYAWPGNVRELRNVLERAVLVHRGPTIHPSRFLAPLLHHGDRRNSSPKQEENLGRKNETERFEPISLAEAKKRHILATLQHCGGNVTHAAATLGVSRSTVQRFLQGFRDT